MKIFEYGRSIHLEYFTDSPSDWHDVYIKPANEDELYKYFGRYFDDLYIPWTSINVYFLLNGQVVDKPITLDYQKDNLFSASKVVYDDYVDGRVWSKDTSNMAKIKQS